MLDMKWIRTHSDELRKGAREKNLSFDVDRLLQLDASIRVNIQDIEALRMERNQLSKEIPKATTETRPGLVARVGDLKKDLERLETENQVLEQEFNQLMLLCPQPARDDVPVGKDDKENVPVRHWGERPTFAFKAKNHLEIAAALRLADFDRGVKLAGSRSYVLTGMGARLEQAILRMVFDHLCRKKYEPLSIPVLVNESAMIGTGYFPTGRDQAYWIEKDEKALVGTAEVALTSFYSDEILDEKDLPKRMMAWSNCFRREAGSYGKDTAGFYRVHQFQKIEQVILCKNDPEESQRLHEELLGNAEDVLQALELPYRVVYVCTGDLGQGQVRKHDIETWMPSREAYGETHSCSTFHEFQARRLKLRYRGSDQANQFCHTLNNTAIASPRILIPFLECHQQEDGSIRIPKALQPYLDGITQIK
jgi:seryl-tRNA synthetase